VVASEPVGELNIKMQISARQQGIAQGVQQPTLRVVTATRRAAKCWYSQNCWPGSQQLVKPGQPNAQTSQPHAHKTLAANMSTYNDFGGTLQQKQTGTMLRTAGAKARTKLGTVQHATNAQRQWMHGTTRNTGQGAAKKHAYLTHCGKLTSSFIIIITRLASK
jgi:hypothetical protein